MENHTNLEKEIFLQNVAEQWKTELNTHKKIYILSPYITSIAESILENVKNKENCEIFTTLQIRNFLSGSSDIKTLKSLINLGFKIYSVPELHAKIILISDTFVSIGSQNLTYSGTKNKEATIISKEKKIVQFVESKVRNWITESKIISFETLVEVEKKLEELKDDYKRLEVEIEKVADFIEEQEKKREKEKQLEIRDRNLLNIGKSTSSLVGKIYSEKKYHSYRGRITDWYTLWTFRSIKRKNIVELFKLEWKQYNWLVQTDFDAETTSDFNIKAKIELKEISIKLELFLFFDYRTLSIRSINPKLDSLESSYQNQELKKIVDWINLNSSNLMKIILEKLLSPFNYDNKLTGGYADQFLNANQLYELRVGRIDNQKLLIFEELGEV